MADTYAIDGLCHNAEPGTFGHECGKPATWLGTKLDGFRSGFCDTCKAEGFEAARYVEWQLFNDWYKRREELEPGQVFRTTCGHFIKLDRHVPGDGTDWYAADWWNGSWAWMDARHHPSDLAERLPDDWAGPKAGG